MAAFRIYLFVTFAAIFAYTVWVRVNEGPIFIQVAIGMVSEFKWPGQFVWGTLATFRANADTTSARQIAS